MNVDCIKRWLSLTEDDVFFQNGTSSVSDLICFSPPSSVTVKGDEYKALCEYRLIALQNLWAAKRQFKNVRSSSRNKEIHKDFSHNNDSTSTASSLSSYRFSLLLIFPLLKSQAQKDPNLTSVTTKLLLQALRECPSLSLPSKDSSLDALENLLADWLTDSTYVEDHPFIASTLVAMACARNSLKTVVKAVHSLRLLKETEQLPVASVIRNLIQGGTPSPPILAESHDLHGWRLKRLSNQYDEEYNEYDEGTRITCNRDFIFLSDGKGLSKIGNGKNGTFKGHIYANNESLGPGFIAYASGILIYKHNDDDNGLVEVDPETLEVKRTISVNEEAEEVSAKTHQIISNGIEFYWIRSTSSEEDEDETTVYLDTFRIFDSDNRVTISRPRIILTKNDEKKETGSKTSCGLSLKILSSGCIISDGNYLSIMNYNSSTTGSRTSKSKPILVHSFSMETGSYHGLTDVTEAVSESFIIVMAAATYDTFNHRIWTLSSRDWIHEFRSRSFPPRDYLMNTVLGIEEKHEETIEDETIPVNRLRTKLLRHGALMSLVQNNQELDDEIDRILEVLRDAHDRHDSVMTTCALRILVKATDAFQKRKQSIKEFLWRILNCEISTDVEKDAASDVLLALTNDEERLDLLLFVFRNDLGSHIIKEKIMSSLLQFLENNLDRDQIKRILDKTEFMEIIFRETADQSVRLLTTQNLNSRVATVLTLITTLMTNLTHFIITANDDDDELNKHFVHFTKRFFKEAQRCLKINDSASDDVIQASLLGTPLQTLVTILSHPKFLSLNRAQDDVRTAVTLLTLTMSSSTFDNVDIPKPWSAIRILESQHPVRDGYKFKEIIGAPQDLYLKFDSRCSTLHDQDKLTIHRGSRKIGEFGGNAGWPKDIYKIMAGGSLIFSFEVKPTRTEVDKTCWGFRISISESESELLRLGKRAIPVLKDLALNLFSLTRSYLEILYRGEPITVQERECEPLLKSQLLQRCVWKSEESSFRNLPRIKLSPQIVGKLKSLSGIGKFPPLRPSVRQIIHPENLEEGILSAVIKHLSWSDFIKNLADLEAEHTAEFDMLIDITNQTYLRINALLRRLQILADLESQWDCEVESLKDGSCTMDSIFFLDYQHNECRSNELILLGFLKGIEVDPDKPGTEPVADLLALMEKEVRSKEESKPLVKTKAVVAGIVERIELLLQVTIYTGLEEKSNNHKNNNSSSSSSSKNNNNNNLCMSRSLQHWPKTLQKQISYEMDRSLDDSILQIPRQKTRKMPSQTMYNHTPESEILDEIFAFIGSHPERAASSESFLKSVQVRRSRSKSRMLSLSIMNDLLKIEGAAYFITTFSSIIKDGPRVDELTCGNEVKAVRNRFTEVMTSAVNVAIQNPTNCSASVAHMCAIPYQRDEEECLVRSGLVGLLDKLCHSSQPELSQLAWSGFKLLANHCILWEDSEVNKLNSLARQLSRLLTHHLVHATSLENNHGNEALQEVLLLLNSLSKSEMGRTILSQSACVSKLLELLLENLSPRMILTIIQLCHVALPLMSEESCEQSFIPQWSLGSHEDSLLYSNQHGSVGKMVRLLMAKLADYLVPGYQTQLYPSSPRKPQIENSRVESPQTPLTPTSNTSTTLSLFVHKREDQSAHEIIQLLLNVNADVRLFQMLNNTNMDKIVKMDKDMTKSHKAEVITEDATTVFRKGIKLSQQGFVVSATSPSAKSEDVNDTVLTCKARNIDLVRNDPLRPFISNTVANNLAAELISLMHSLMKTESNPVWMEAIATVLKSSLHNLMNLVKSADTIFDVDTSSDLFKIYSEGRKVMAALSILGAFSETLKPGISVKIKPSRQTGIIVSINDENGTAVVDLDTNNGEKKVRTHIVLNRLEGLNRLDEKAQSLFGPIVLKELIDACHILFLPEAESGIDPLSSALPAQGEGKSLKLAVSRLLAEIRTRTCQLLSLYLDDEEFVFHFMHGSSQAVDMLKLLSKDVWPSDKFDTIIRSRENLKALYRDSVKPPAPPTKRSCVGLKLVIWDPSRSFPPIKSVFFSHNMTGLTYHSDPVMVSGLPRGAFIYANQPINSDRYYFEVDIMSLGENVDESSANAPVLSVGLAPLIEKREGPWNNPVGTVLFHNNGRVVHYRGTSLLQWRSLRFDQVLNPGDTVGLLWETGTVKFTYNGILLDQAFEDVDGGLYPVVHVQKKGVRIKGNFGTQAFQYRDFSVRVAVEDSESDSNDLPSSTSNEPFDDMKETCLSTQQTTGYLSAGAGHRRMSSVASRIALKPKTRMVYDVENAAQFRPQSSGSPALTSGPNMTRFTTPLDDSDDSDDESEEHMAFHEDLNSLVVKAWETKIFPIIRRRFRNDTERKDGLEQIKGALALGMSDIARQTVEFLYEEHGGIPRDLHLPTIEDIKDDLNKLSIDAIKNGQRVLIAKIENQSAQKFGPEPIVKTLGLIGEVLEVDTINELIQVETYLQFEGTLMRYWYPISFLEKPSSENSRTRLSKGVYSNAFHRELLNHEYTLSRLYCRSAYIKLLNYSRKCDLEKLILNPSSHDVVTSVMLLRDADPDNLQLVSDACLKKCPGNVLDGNIGFAPSNKLLRQNFSGIFSDMFFETEEDEDEYDKILKDEMDELMLKETDELFELSDQICSCLDNAIELFPLEEIVINDLSILKSVIQFKGVGFVLAACKFGKNIDPLSLHDLQIQIQTLNGGELKTNGQNTARDIVQYPLPTHGDGADVRAFAPILLANDMIRISHGGGGGGVGVGCEDEEDQDDSKYLTLCLYGIHHQFPLAIRFIETLLFNPVSRRVLFHAMEKLCTFLWKYSAPPLIKENVFRLLNKVLNKLPEASHPNLFTALINELDYLYFLERSNKPFSTYFQALFELSVTIACRSKKFQLQRKFEKLTESDDEEEWFPAVLKVLRNIKEPLTFENNDIYPKDHARILILQGLPKHLTVDDIRTSILKVVDPLGGIYKDEIYVPDPNPSSETFVSPNNRGFAVIQIRFSAKIDAIKAALEKCPVLSQLGEMDLAESSDVVGLRVGKVNAEYVSFEWAEEPLKEYLRHKIIRDGRLSKIFCSQNVVTHRSTIESETKLSQFLSHIDQGSVSDFMSKYGSEKDNEQLIQKDGILKYLEDKDIISIFKGLSSLSYDNEDKCGKDDNNMILSVNRYCKDFSISPFNIDPDEMYEDKVRFSILRSFNESVIKTDLLSMLDLRHADCDNHVSFKLKKILFNKVKMDFFESLLTNRRDSDHAPPEITLNPIEEIGKGNANDTNTWFYQAMVQLGNTTSSEFCVPLATGGDPQLPIYVRMTGSEEVLGNSGSFRQFLSQITKELQSPALPILTPYLGVEHKGLWMLKAERIVPYRTEKLLQFFGQILGMSLRSGIPLALDLMPYCWKSLSGLPPTESELRDFDPITYDFLEEIGRVSTPDEFEEFLEEHQFPKMTCLSMSGNEENLKSGENIEYLSWTNRFDYIKLVKEFKLNEMKCEERWNHIKAGMATIVPLEVLTRLFTPSEIESAVCGSTNINVHYLKEHTIYQVGITENDAHVQHFWNVLETFTQPQLERFIKFACNQDRIQTSSLENLPPYPMKIAPADITDQEDIDRRNIRVETCMFMIKLPRYSTYEIMKTKLLFALSAALDPLSG